MDIALMIIGFLILVLGFIGDFLPVLPGPILSFGALFLLQLTSHQPFDLTTLIILFAVAVIVTVLDYVVPILGTKRMGGSKRGSRGSTVGLIVGVIILPILGITIGPFGLLGLIGGPFLGAYIGEKAYQNKHIKETEKKHTTPLKAAFGSFLGFIAGIMLKIVYTIIVGVYFFQSIFQIIKAMGK